MPLDVFGCQWVFFEVLGFRYFKFWVPGPLIRPARSESGLGARLRARVKARVKARVRGRTGVT